MKLNNLRLSTRITLGMILLLALSALLWVATQNAHLREDFLAERRADLETALHTEQMRMTQNIEALRQNAVFLANVPPISGIARAAANDGFDPRDGNTFAVWEKRLQEIFSAFLRAHPQYLQVRYIGVADGGREIVRVKNLSGAVEVVPRNALQSRGERDYFQAGLALAAGRVHLSDFAPHLESGGNSDPQRPLLRAVTPVFDAGGHVFGLVVIEQSARPLFESARAALPLGIEALIADQHGRYLMHPDGAAGSGNFFRDFPSLQSWLERRAENYLPLRAVAEGGHYLAAERVFFDSDMPSRFLLLAYRIPAGVAAAQSEHFARRDLAFTLLLVLALGALLWLLLRRSFAPLENITLAAREIAAGDLQLRLPSADGGEIGALTIALNSMLDKLVAHDAALRENAFRKELIESLPGVFYMIDEHGNFLLWNRNLETVLQRGGEEIAFSRPQDFFAGEDKNRIVAAMRQVFAQGEVSLEATLLPLRGAGIPYYFTGRRAQHEGEPVLVGMGLDISQQKLSARVAESLFRRNQSLMQSSMEGIHVMDVAGNVLEVNKAFCDMLGYSREEAMRLNVRDWDDQFTSEELERRFRQLIGHSTTFETRHKRRDGSLLDVEICATGIEIDGAGVLFASSRDITERKQLQRVLLRNKQMIDTAMDGYWMTDERGFVEEANAAYAKISGYSPEELVGMHISQLEAQEDEEAVQRHIAKLIADGSDRFETRHRRKDGGLTDIEVSATFMPECRKFFVFCHDITERKRSEEALRVAAATFETQDATLITDDRANIIRVNRAFSEITGYSAQEVLGKNPRIMSSGRHDKAFYAAMWQQIRDTGSWAGEVWDRRKSGEIYPKWLTITAVKNARGETAQYVAIFNDITARKQAEDEIRNLAFYDALTGLPNRRLFQERFHAALVASARYRDFGAILFIDLDRFKVLNDTLGHDYGDLLLVEVAQRIRDCVREMDTVARLGGDEFVVLLESVSSVKEDAEHKAGLVAEKIREALSRCYRLKEHEHYSSPSIGITLYCGDEVSMDALMQHADAAMYQAKSAGRNAVRFFDPDMQQNMVQRSSLEIDLRRAIENGELYLYYQIQVDNLRRPVGAEALIRWISPQRGMVSPASFIPVAEESAIILEIGNWVLETGCAQLAAWGRDENLRGLTLALNVSAHQFRRHDFVGQVAAVIQRHRIEPSRLKLELTESVVVDDMDEVVNKMLALKNLGVLLSLDDFGTGYSSLSYLKRLPLDQIKIDQSFVRGITVDPGDAVMVQTIIDMAKNFKLEVIAEGVETETQFEFLKLHDCMAFQGYLFGKPLPLREMETLVAGRIKD